MGLNLIMRCQVEPGVQSVTLINNADRSRVDKIKP